MSDYNPGKILVAILIAVALGGAMAVAGSDGSVAVGGWPLFALCGALAYLINWLVYLPSMLAQTEKYFDLTGGITYLAVTATACIGAGNLDTRAMVVASLVAIWALRLASFLFMRISKEGKDGRFDTIKTIPLRFFMTWTLQGLWVLLTIAAALAVITSEQRVPFGWVGALGVALWVAGFLIEAIADRQKSRFKSNPDNEGQFINEGLWAWSRHPNYFGEILLWTGIAVIAIPVLAGWQWATLISPFFVTLLLTKISGIPLLEKRADERWGDDPAYQQYKANTPVLIPRPPSGS